MSYHNLVQNFNYNDNEYKLKNLLFFIIYVLSEITFIGKKFHCKTCLFHYIDTIEIKKSIIFYQYSFPG